MLIAKLAINETNNTFDKLYDYIIPDHLDIKPGFRVLVPFGRGNRLVQGIVLKISNDTLTENLKVINKALDDFPLLNEEMIKIAVFMRNNYFTTLFDSIKAMLPSGIWIDRTESYFYNHTNNTDIGSYKGVKKEIINLLKDETFALTIKIIEDRLNIQNIKQYLNELVNAGVLFMQSSTQQRTKNKKTKIISLATDIEVAKQRISKLRSSMYSIILEQFILNENLDIKTLCYETGASTQQVSALVKQGILQYVDMQVYRKPFVTGDKKYQDIILSPKQDIAYNQLKTLMISDKANCSLLFGVTGSGKTGVYIKLIMDTLKADKTAILMVPEIALTPQMIQKFLMYFGDDIAVVHSALSDGERLDEYSRLRQGKARIAIGTRSAVFAPLENIGIIIMDEEGESSYKSENNPRFHARDIAKYRCMYNNALLVLGSATPSIETYYNTTIGKYNISIIDERYGGTNLPEVIISDMKGGKLRDSAIGDELYECIKNNLKNASQTVLFINRRGDSRNLTCVMCAYTPECINCSTNMTYHSFNNRVICHYCGYSKEVPPVCPSCKSRHIKLTIPGTQRIENELYELFPGIKILRMDADTTNTKNSHQKILNDFRDGKADILLGTQMVTKGLDFENVTLAGVIDSDQGLYSEDYRAAERTFSLITQVIGRAGRRLKQGRAVIQTYSPEHIVITCAAMQDYIKFYEYEITQRSALLAPPFYDIIMITGIAENEHLVLTAMMNLRDRMKLLLNTYKDIDAKVIGPAPADIVRKNKKYRYHIVIRAKNTKELREFIRAVIFEFNKTNKNKLINIFVDINPVNI